MPFDRTDHAVQKLKQDSTARRKDYKKTVLSSDTKKAQLLVSDVNMRSFTLQSFRNSTYKSSAVRKWRLPSLRRATGLRSTLCSAVCYKRPRS